jgi:HK97 family phage portal protein
MGWLSGKSAPAGRKAVDLDALARIFGGPDDPEWPASSFQSHIRNGYEKNELVYACITERVNAVAEAPIRAYASSSARRGQPIETHPMRKLLATPNPLMSETELFSMIELHLSLAGIAFIEVVADRAGTPVELWPLRPDLVRMKRGKTSIEYFYAVDGSRRVPVDVIPIRLPNPWDPFVGQPPMRPALRATEVDNRANSFVGSLLKNHAMPSVIVTMGDLEDALDDTTTNRLKTKWKQSYGGANMGEPAFLQTGMDVKTVGFNLRDLEFPDLRTISESRICAAFQVPPIVVGAAVGLNRSTFANYAEARRSFYEEFVTSENKLIREAFTRHLLPRFRAAGRSGVILRHDYSEVLALQETEEKRWTRATEGLRAGGLTLNDYRREVGLDEVPGGDVFLMPSGVIVTRDEDGRLQHVGDDPAVADPEQSGAKTLPLAEESKQIEMSNCLACGTFYPSMAEATMCEVAHTRTEGEAR